MKKKDLNKFIYHEVSTLYRDIELHLYVDYIKKAYADRRFYELLQYIELGKLWINTKYPSEKHNLYILEIFQNEIEHLIKIERR